MYLLRLDDASNHMNNINWIKMEELLDKYNIKPIVGVIPNNQDLNLLQYDYINGFWERVKQWETKGWTIALHGYNHVYETKEGGINPVKNRSEFAGLPLERQKEKIKNGYNVFLNNGVIPKLFYAPSHTFDKNTLTALKEETNIRYISDTIANDVYYYDEFFFIPQQSGAVRKLPFSITTFCYHPNKMEDNDFERLDIFLKKYLSNFISFNDIELKKRKKSLYDWCLKQIYFLKIDKNS